MVAYGFKARFVPLIQAGTKRQTIRLPRRRHARPEERVQLYHAMRTPQCFKIIPDPVCIGLDRLVIDTRSGALDHIEINGVVIRIGTDEVEAFAQADGFGGTEHPAAEVFGRWWTRHHGRALHEDLVLVRWEDRP